MIDIRQAESDEQIEEARTLFREYEKSIGLDLCFQGFEGELAELPGKYSKPDGRLYIAYSMNNPAGCIALRKMHKDACEMKRLFVRDEFRGQTIGIQLVERLISDAREIGYTRMLLDTIPSKMGRALGLYQLHGFHEIPPYYDNPNSGVLFMELVL